MRLLSNFGRMATLLLSLLTTLVSFVAAQPEILSTSLTTCMKNSELSASLFQVAFTPDNRTLSFAVEGVTTITGYVWLEIDVIAYGYNALSKREDPCTVSSLKGLCPMSAGQIVLPGQFTLPQSTVNAIPSIAYNIPDLDGQVQIKILQKDNLLQVACVQAKLTNGKSVYQKGVGWASAVIAGLALLTSAIVSGLGHSNTATHIAANALSLFGFFQKQALFGMTAIALPPIVSSWTQNFQWSMGIIQVDFIQIIASWYQQSTGGTPSTLLNSLSVVSVNVVKRSADFVKRAAMKLAAQSPSASDSLALVSRQADGGTSSTSSITVRGIERVGYNAGIEITNVFMTGYMFFFIFVVLVVLGVIAFRWALEALARSGKIKGDQFQDFRNGWTTVLRGILFRIILIGFPQMVILCFWELVHQDSAGEEALAVITVLTIIVMLVWACTKVWLLARRSVSLHKNPAYILYSDPVCLHKWGFLYVQFKATAYWFIMPVLGFTLVEGLFVAFGQNDGVAQAIGLLILEAGQLIAVSILRPYMDRKTNAFNISISSVNFASTVFLLFFTNIFGLPGLVVGIMGIVFFFLNAIFALVLLLMVLVATGYAIFSKNPDVRYQPMRDDRGSFIKSQSQLTTELDALGAAARGEAKTPFKRDFDSESYDGSADDYSYGAIGVPYSKEGSQRSTLQHETAGFSQRSSMRSNPSAQAPRSGAASPWQRGAGYER